MDVKYVIIRPTCMSLNLALFKLRPISNTHCNLIKKFIKQFLICPTISRFKTHWAHLLENEEKKYPPAAGRMMYYDVVTTCN